MAEVAPRRRHDLVRAEPSAWRAVLAVRPDLADLPWVAGWAARGWPLMVRRPAGVEAEGRVPLGLPLPPSAGKLRLAFDLPPGALGAPEPPPLLSVAAASAAPAWRETLERLLALDPDVRVFGALAWQTLTGLDYLSPTSDIDLLWPMPPAGRLDDRLAAIAAIEAEAPMRLDGEVVRRDGAAVNWRELASGADEVLVKRLDCVALQSRRTILEAAA
jgi:phosphoribosyl-dephospho-CoA transferase